MDFGQIRVHGLKCGPIRYCLPVQYPVQYHCTDFRYNEHPYKGAVCEIQPRASPMLQSMLRPAGMLNARRSAYAVIRNLSTTPDFNTSVDVHKHSISLRQTRAEKLKEMTPATTGSLIPDSIKHVEEDEEHITTAENLKKLGQAALTREERVRRRRALDQFGLPTFADFLNKQKLEKLSKKPISILQMNIGLYCNQVWSVRVACDSRC